MPPRRSRTMVMQVDLGTIPTAAGNTDKYINAPCTGRLIDGYFSGLTALAAHDSNYMTFSVTKSEAGASTAMLAATDANTTKATGGTATSINTKRSLTKSATAANLEVTEGDRLLVRVAGTGTLANTVTQAVITLLFERTA